MSKSRCSTRDERLWRDHEVVGLSPKAFAVLQCLIGQPGQLVTKDTLLSTVWPETVITESSLTGCIWELRQALGDSSRTPHYIETVYGRGYRFIAPVTETVAHTSEARSQGDRPQISPIRHSQPTPLVGREGELTQLQMWCATAHQGQRQVGFIVGEPGIGKTALVEAFAALAAANAPVRVAHGQCIEQYGAGEPYLPLLEAISRLCRDADGEEIVAIIRQAAPSWLAHLPAVISPDERESLARMIGRVSPVQMLRELAEALELLTATRVLILVLEDLHWSDVATLEWLHYMARRRDPAQLLVLGTFRPAEVIVRQHPLHRVRAELRQLPQCAELILDYLSETAVNTYLSHRLGTSSYDAKLVQVLHQHTSGNPLFLTAVVEDLLSQGVLEQSSEVAPITVVTELIPTSIRALIEHHLDQLSPEEQAMLEAASVEGMVFSVAGVAASVTASVESIETRWATWARGDQFLHAADVDTWPDGTVTARYCFRHALYQKVVYSRISPGRLVRLHQQVGIRKEAAYGGRVSEIAAELAVHFLRGRDLQRAIQYLRMAGENALQRSAYQEAISHLTKGLQCLSALPSGAERDQQELYLQTALGPVLMATKGYASADVERTYTRARELSKQMAEDPQLFPILAGLSAFYIVRGDHEAAMELSHRLLTFAEQAQAPLMLLTAHGLLGGVLYGLGEIHDAWEHWRQSIAYHHPDQFDTNLRLFGFDGKVFCLSWNAHAIWLLGYPDQALTQSQEALTLAQELSHPLTLVVSHAYAAILYHFCQDHYAAERYAEAAIALCSGQGFTYYLALGTLIRGWAWLRQGLAKKGVTEMQQGLESLRATGAGVRLPYYYAILAEAYGRAGNISQSLDMLDTAFVQMQQSQEKWWEAELYRLRGQALLAQSTNNHIEAEACFQKAQNIAISQQARSLELRAATSLARLWQRQGKRQEAHDLLAPVYNWFTEGFDTADFKDAKALLDELV